MSQETPIILYVGDIETAQWLESTLGTQVSYIYAQDELLPALGIYVSYMPDLVILNARTMPDLARETYAHLLSVDAERLLIIDDSAEDWVYPAEAQIQVLTSSSKSDLLTTISDLMGTLSAV